MAQVCPVLRFLAAVLVRTLTRSAVPAAGMLLTSALWSGAILAAPIPLEQGEIAGAPFTIARPARWNHSLLLVAHGYRPESAPLVADLFPEHAAYHALLEEGWIVAKTAYRRNGIVLGDALEDIDRLRAYVENKYGRLDRVIVEGESMGGTLATLIAEREPAKPPLYHGVVAIDVALTVHDPAAPNLGVSLQPKIPLLFVSNQNELQESRDYVRTKIKRDVNPVIFTISRDGHVNLNQAERLVALRSLIGWIDHGPSELPAPIAPAAYFDATQTPSPLPSQVILDPDHRGLTARVVEVSAIYGNVSLNIQPADLAAIGVVKGAYFEVAAKGHRFRVLSARDFADVKRGHWLVFPNADGFYWLARNYANAAESMQVGVGDEIKVRSFSSATPPEPAENEE